MIPPLNRLIHSPPHVFSLEKCKIVFGKIQHPALIKAFRKIEELFLNGVEKYRSKTLPLQGQQEEKGSILSVGLEA